MSVRQLVTFSVDDTLYGVDILAVREVLRDIRCSPVPGAHDAIVGLMNLRGQVVTVLDLGRRLSAGPQRRQCRKACVILKTDEELARLGPKKHPAEVVGSDPVGIAVDEMGEVLSIESSELREPPATMSEETRRLVKNVANLESALLTELSLGRVVNLKD